MQNQVTRMFRVKQVAEMYDVSVSTIYRAIEARQLEALRIGSGSGAIRIPEHALRAFEASCVLDPAEVADLAPADQAGVA